MGLTASLKILSTSLDPEEITERLGVQPTEVRHQAAYPQNGVSLPKTHIWRLELPNDPDLHFGTAGISAAIETLDDQLADKFATLPADGVDKFLDLHQAVDGDNDHESSGIHLTSAALGWLVRAGLDIDIDQYFYTNGATEASLKE